MAGEWIAIALVALAGALLGTLALRRPRLRASATLRGGTRDGTLYVLVENAGATAARRVRARIAWAAPGAEAVIDERDLGTLPARDAVRIEARDIQRAWGDARASWSEIRVTLRAVNALPARAALPLQGRASAGASQAPPASYVAPSRCPASPDGRHRLERQEFPNDGVQERWEVCRACRHVQRLPLTPAEDAIQARARAERAERERRRLEEDWAREEQARRRERPPRREEPGGLPLAVAYWVLGLDESATWEDVLAAHRRLALVHHPDRAHGAGPRVREALESRMQEINRARDRLREHLAR